MTIIFSCRTFAWWSPTWEHIAKFDELDCVLCRLPKGTVTVPYYQLYVYLHPQGVACLGLHTLCVSWRKHIRCVPWTGNCIPFTTCPLSIVPGLFSSNVNTGRNAKFSAIRLVAGNVTCPEFKFWRSGNSMYSYNNDYIVYYAFGFNGYLRVESKIDVHG